MPDLSYNLAVVEVVGLSSALVIADHALKAADVVIVGVEGDAGQMAMIKMVGDAANCQRAIETARRVAEQMRVKFYSTLRLNFVDSKKVRLVESEQEYSSINEAFFHILPKKHERGINMQAIGLLETQGLTGVIEGADVMLKAANVELIGKEKIGAAQVTVMIRGDVAAVKAAVEAGKEAAARVGTLVCGHVISRPHESLAKLLPE